MKRSFIALLALLLVARIFPCQAQATKVSTLKVTVLSTMLAGGVGIGEWGFCALIEVDGKKILFDTGARPETVLHNAEEMNIDLSTITDVFISHSHGDHTGGLMTLRKAMMAKNPAALSVIHIGEGAFYERPSDAEYAASMKKIKTDFEQSGGRFVVYTAPRQLFPGVWITGPVPRHTDEKNWSGSGTVKTPQGITEDNVPEDQSLLINTHDGLVIISGCGHSGIVNTIDYAAGIFTSTPVNTLIGGFHLFNQTDEKVKWTATHLKAAGVKKIIGAHCTGINAVYLIREQLALSNSDCVVGGVGAVFELSKPIYAGPIAK